MNAAVNNVVSFTGQYVGKAARITVDASKLAMNAIVRYSTQAGKAMKAGAKAISRILGFNKHTVIVGTAAAFMAGAVTHVGATASILSATCAVAAWSGLIAIPLMALYVVMMRMLGHKMSFKQLFGAANWAMLVPYTAVYGLYYVAVGMGYLFNASVWTWLQAAVLFVL